MKTTEVNPFDWVHEKNNRKGALKLTLKAMREGWSLSDADRAKLRSEMEWLRDSAGIRDRERPIVAEVLELLDGPPPARPRRHRATARATGG